MVIPSVPLRLFQNCMYLGALFSFGSAVPLWGSMLKPQKFIYVITSAKHKGFYHIFKLSAI